METTKYKEETGSALQYYVLFFCTVGVLLLFNPDTNGNNLPEFSLIKLVGFLVALVFSLGVLFSPLIVNRFQITIGWFYGFCCLVFVPTEMIYIFQTIKHIAQIGGAHA